MNDLSNGRRRKKNNLNIEDLTCMLLAHIFSNLLNKLRKRDKMRGFITFFPNKFNKFNNTEAQNLDSTYHNIVY